MKILAHLDLDAFFAAVEELENPELRERPLVVGGDPHSRGVVSTANYAARKFGIHSAMSAAEALRRCPTAIFLRPRHALYRQYSRVVWDTIGEIVPRIERTGIDEGYLDLGTVSSDFTRARGSPRRSRPPSAGRPSLTCSLGVGTSKVVCKIASDRRKPGGITVVPPGTEARFLAPLAVRLLPGVGPRAEERLRSAGVETIGGLAALEDAELRALLPGTIGPLLRDRARASTRAISTSSSSRCPYPPRTRSRATSPIASGCTTRCDGSPSSSSERLRNAGLSGRTVTAKLRYADFSIRTRSTTLPAAVDEAELIGRVACGLLDRGLRDRPGALSLVGVGVSGLSPYRQLTLEES